MAPATSTEAPNPLPDLPRLPEEPRSLLAAPAPAVLAAVELPGPYFEADARLDPPCLPAIGWFASTEVEIVGAHVKNRLFNTVSIAGGPLNLVHLPSGELNWTVAPRLDLGYRFPSGFGEILVSYRGLATDGTQSIITSDGPATLHSRLDLNVADLDYACWEFSLWPNWDIKWRIGGRFADVFFDSREVQPFAQAAAGNGIVESRVTNNYWGIGPHWGVELARHIDEYGLAFVCRADGAVLLGHIRQGFFETSTIPGPGGLLHGETTVSGNQAVPMLNAQAGLGWRPPAWPQWLFFAGYEYEYWWNMGRESSTSSRGEMSNQGVAVRAEFSF
jgi:hypothetical protein